MPRRKPLNEQRGYRDQNADNEHISRRQPLNGRVRNIQIDREIDERDIEQGFIQDGEESADNERDQYRQTFDIA
ncbi:hypothetical protein PACILC2_12700 [Paenibacillus cisolokensis]|uniref:Uncharacterized protein n=1 Tax=Paenibacillus cisolokensis TaxID=1658519 RepID=A0ABQ4N3G1_9BACL|nr:hypothetical protein PACILC2_12700 [Paenibacillus cisolokensis]